MAIIQNITGKILIQIGDGQPVEIGTVEIPIEVSTQPVKPGPVYRGDNDAGMYSASHLKPRVVRPAVNGG